MADVCPEKLHRSRLCSIAVALCLVACGGGESASTGGGVPPAGDTTPPSISAVNVAPAGAGATITWTTNEPADSQIEYGQTAGYGATSALDAAMVSSHSVGLAGLSAATLYHYRVRSRDAAGNLATSGDLTFTTPAAADITPPTVAITTPAANATVAGSISVTATAADNIGVVGVTFRVDGTALGGEDLAPPYSITWNTAGAINGAHALTAVARDAAGNQTVSASITVSVANAPPPTGAAISVGQIEIDPPTLETIGVALPITSGDTNYNASVLVSFRRVGDSAWRAALPLLRVRPEMLSDEDPTSFTIGEQFAGSIFDLVPDTEYEVQLEVRDPDGGNTTRSAVMRTRATPVAEPAAARVVNVSTAAQFTAALANALAGDVITLANGVYQGPFTLARSGTAASPIFIRGASRDGVIIDATGSNFGLTLSGSFVTAENLTVRNSTWGMRVSSAQHAVVRRVRITGVSYGIDGRGGTKRNFYICDNVLEGIEAVWPRNENALWLFEGIVVTGQGHVVCHNLLSGFGDALGLHEDTAIPNRAIDFYGNEVIWSGDNGVELDYGERNIRAFRNRITNAGNMPLSFQPIYGGPAYALRNVVYNSGIAPFKLNNEPTGIYILHNTAVRPGWAWGQYGARADNLVMHNNIVIGTTNAVDVTTVLTRATIDYNAWLPDGQFRFTDTWTSFASLQANSPYEHNGRLLNGLPFAAPLTIPPTFTTFVQPLNAVLRAASNVVDAGIRLPNINDGFNGANPDLGALELGAPEVRYGPR